jgi:diguanylate cyclase (GGDEF)-like protein
MHPTPKEPSVAPVRLKKDPGALTQSEPAEGVHLSEVHRDITLKGKFYSSLAFKVLLGYIVLWGLGCILLSDSFLGMLGMDPAAIEQFKPFRRWIFLLFTAPLLYWLVFRQATSLQHKNDLLGAAEKKVMRLNRMHKVLSEINHVILRARDRKHLLHEICNIVQERGHFSFVWIGLGETEAVLPQVIVTSGEGSQYLQELFDGLQIASSEERGEPALASFRKKYHVVINDIKTYSKKQFAWQRRALDNSYQSVAAFPIKTSSGMSGVFAIYASETQVFSQEEVDLLRELAADVSYGLSDIEQKEQLYYAANYDVITNLPNRQLLEDRLNQTIARAYHDKRCVGLAFIELIELDSMINAYGQAAGDKILQETAKHLSRLVRDGDTIARLGNNQLGVMLADVADVYDIPVVIQKIMRSFLVHLTNHKDVTIKMLAGVSIYPKDAENGVMLIKNAELALRGISPDEKIDCAFFSKEIESGTKYAQSIEEELEGALERQEFTLYYQPIVDSDTRKVVGVEALMRWRNPKLGEVSPAQFISIAEDKNWITGLGEWTLKTACMQLKEWKSNGMDLTVSVNMSSKHIMQPQFLEKLKILFTAMKFNPEEYSLAFEISETALIDEPKHVIELFIALREMGIKIYVDDFGTGYASLSYLHGLPVDILKIDSMFVRTLEKDPTVKTMIKGILAFASGLGVKTIAEGVETEKQLKILRHLGCTLVQGYVFSAPMLSKSVSTLFHRQL